MKINGIVLKGIGGFYYVEAAGSVYECRARGIFRKDRISPLPGDFVEISVRPDSENTIDTIQPRKNCFQRPPVANLDQLIIVVSICDPNPNTLIIDKLTAIAQSKDIETIIVVTKADMRDTSDLVNLYLTAGFKTISVSGNTGEGVQSVKDILAGNISAFTGNSGVGKTTLLNCIDTNLLLKTAETSEKLGRGKHTTRYIELYKISGGFVADTPGFASLDFENNGIILKDDLQFCFKEFLPYLGKCKFSTCAHLTDFGCGIIEAVNKGEISKSRHNSYITMYNELRDKREWKL